MVFQAYWVRKTNVGVECLVAQTPIHTGLNCRGRRELSNAVEMVQIG